MRIASILVGLAILIGCGYALTQMPWSVETQCSETNKRFMCIAITTYVGRTESLTLGPADLIEPRSARVGAEQGAAFRPVLVLGKDKLELPLLLDGHTDALNRAQQHAKVGPPVSVKVAPARFAIVGAIGLLGLLLVLSSIFRKR